MKFRARMWEGAGASRRGKAGISATGAEELWGADRPGVWHLTQKWGSLGNRQGVCVVRGDGDAAGLISHLSPGTQKGSGATNGFEGGWSARKPLPDRPAGSSPETTFEGPRGRRRAWAGPGCAGHWGTGLGAAGTWFGEGGWQWLWEGWPLVACFLLQVKTISLGWLPWYACVRWGCVHTWWGET